MKRMILAATLATIPCVGSCGGLGKFLQALDEATQQAGQSSGGAPVIPDICIGEVCVGDDISSLELRLDTAQVELIRSPQDIYKNEYVACEQERPSKLAEAKLAQKQELDRAKSTTIPAVRQNANMRAGMLGVTVDLYSSNQVCIDRAKKNAEEYAAPIVARQGKIRNFVVSWSSTESKVDANGIIGAHPEATVVAETNEVGGAGGVLVLFAKSNAGSYKDVATLGTACQPVAIQGTVDGGKTSFIALNDPASGSFRVVGVNTVFSSLTQDQIDNVIGKYWEKFGKYAAANTYPANQQPGFQVVFFNQSKDSVSVTAVHPALSSYNDARNISSESPGAKIKGQFVGVAQGDGFIRSVPTSRFSPYEFSVSPYTRAPIEFMKVPRCSAIRNKASSVDIR